MLGYSLVTASPNTGHGDLLSLAKLRLVDRGVDGRSAQRAHACRAATGPGSRAGRSRSSQRLLQPMPELLLRGHVLPGVLCLLFDVAAGPLAFVSYL
jgi:hypothetical protein